MPPVCRQRQRDNECTDSESVGKLNTVNHRKHSKRISQLAFIMYHCLVARDQDPEVKEDTTIAHCAALVPRSYSTNPL